jgi:hypothetical protein
MNWQFFDSAMLNKTELAVLTDSNTHPTLVITL